MDSFWNASSKKTNVNSMKDYLNQSVHDSLYSNKRVLLLEVFNNRVVERLRKDKISYTSNLISNITKTSSPGTHIVTSLEASKVLSDIINGSNDNQGEENENI